MPDDDNAEQTPPTETTAARVERAENVESDRAGRAQSVESDRAGRAESVESDRVGRAETVETDRAGRAEFVEGVRASRAEKVEGARVGRAIVIEDDRLARALLIEDDRLIRASTIRRQMWFLFGFILIAFVVLAIRTEQASGNIERTSFTSCEKRANLAVDYNKGRESLVQWITTSQSSESRTPEEKQEIIRQLRDGLLLPIEECGVAP